MMYKINKCPICRSDGVIKKLPMIGMYAVTCSKCQGITTGYKFFLKDACQMWNDGAIIESNISVRKDIVNEAAI